MKVVNTLLGAVKLRSIRVEDVDASGFGREGIFVGGAAADRSQSGYQDVLILRCAAHDNAYFGILVTGAGDPKATAYANHDVVIADCTAFENPGDPSYMESHSGNGILLEDVDTGRIERCVAFGNGALCNNKGGGPVGIWAHSARRVTIQHCASCRNCTGRSVDGGGFDFDGGVSESLMQYNYSSINDGAGYLLYAYPGSPHEFRGNVVRYNISEDDGLKNQYGGFYVVNDGSGVRDLEIYNNTVLVSPSLEGRPRAVVVRKTEGVHFRNNLFQTTGGVPLLEVGADQPGLLFQGNAYWSGGAFFAIDDGGNTDPGKFMPSSLHTQHCRYS